MYPLAEQLLQFLQPFEGDVPVEEGGGELEVGEGDSRSLDESRAVAKAQNFLMDIQREDRKVGSGGDSGHGEYRKWSFGEEKRVLWS